MLPTAYKGTSKHELKAERRRIFVEYHELITVLKKDRDAINDQTFREQFWANRVAREQIESGFLLLKAHSLGIEYPTQEDNPKWWNSNVADAWLSEHGQIRLNKLIKDERRKNIEWWVKVITPLLGALISLMGLVIALITVLKK
mgnify:CR=1 FL=1